MEKGFKEVGEEAEAQRWKGTCLSEVTQLVVELFGLSAPKFLLLPEVYPGAGQADPSHGQGSPAGRRRGLHNAAQVFLIQGITWLSLQEVLGLRQQGLSSISPGPPAAPHRRALGGTLSPRRDAMLPAQPDVAAPALGRDSRGRDISTSLHSLLVKKKHT